MHVKCKKLCDEELIGGAGLASELRWLNFISVVYTAFRVSLISIECW